MSILSHGLRSSIESSGGQAIPIYDVAVIGGGIIGVSAATYLAEAGLAVVLIEGSEIGAGASGRNSGAVQHPFDPLLASLHRRTIELYRELAAGDHGFLIDPQPAGLVVVSDDSDAVARAAVEIAELAPELAPVVLTPAELARLEPLLARGMHGCWLATGYPVAPEAATLAFARRARLAGVEIRVGERAAPQMEGTRPQGVRLESGGSVVAGQVLIAAGPRTSGIVPAWAKMQPIRPLWGVVVEVSLVDAPRHVIEELGIDRAGPPPETLFSLVSAGGRVSLGSTFLEREPTAGDWIARLLERGERYAPAIASARVIGHRLCARPVTGDGRPLIGALAGSEGLFVCAGHGPWGISTGPASARLIVDQMMGNAAEDAALSPGRLSAATVPQYGYGNAHQR